MISKVKVARSRDQSWPNAVPVSLAAGGGIPCRPNQAATLLVTFENFSQLKKSFSVFLPTCLLRRADRLLSGCNENGRLEKKCITPKENLNYDRIRLIVQYIFFSWRRLWLGLGSGFRITRFRYNRN